jgi:hypothetical protein
MFWEDIPTKEEITSIVEISPAFDMLKCSTTPAIIRTIDDAITEL